MGATENNNKLIAFFCYVDKTNPSMLNIINHGIVKNGNIEYLSKNGIKKQPIDNIEMCKVFDVSEIDYKDSLYWWFSKNQGHHDKQIVINENLETGEIYQGNFWRYKLLINPTEKEIELKIIFD